MRLLRDGRGVVDELMLTVTVVLVLLTAGVANCIKPAGCSREDAAARCIVGMVQLDPWSMDAAVTAI